MILSFSKPKFEQKIKDGIKVHTIRLDGHGRWKKGTTIQFWKGNPRNKGSYPFGTGMVNDVHNITILSASVVINDFQYFDPDSLQDIATNDGFESWQEMKEFFPDGFIGRLIFWKEFKSL